MPIERNTIVKFCQDYLKVDKFSDSCTNGLQVEGAPKTAKIITGVSLSQALIRAAIKKRAKMIIVHHGLFNSHFPQPPQLKSYLKERLRLLLENNINLCGFHLPLDAHPVVGNNASILKLLGLAKPEPIDTRDYGAIGYTGEYAEAMKLTDFVARVNAKIGTNAYVIAAGPRMVKKVGVISGGAGNDFMHVKALGADTYLTGDIHEHLVRAIEEEKMNYINAGHYNTEVFGIRNLGELIAKKFNINVEFIDIPCDV